MWRHVQSTVRAWKGHPTKGFYRRLCCVWLINYVSMDTICPDQCCRYEHCLCEITKLMPTYYLASPYLTYLSRVLSISKFFFLICQGTIGLWRFDELAGRCHCTLLPRSPFGFRPSSCSRHLSRLRIPSALLSCHLYSVQTDLLRASSPFIH